MISLRFPILHRVFLCLPVFSMAAQAGPVLSVESVSGEVRVDHLGESRVLQVGDELRERDVMKLPEDARLSLRFGIEGALEVGPGALLAIEKLPAADDAADLRSIFTLSSGYLHVIWNRPLKPWPLYVYFGGQRASLVGGEYFFDRRGDQIRSCVAAGQLAITAISGEGVETLRPSACYRIAADGARLAQPRSPEAWVGVRRDFTLDPGKQMATIKLADRLASRETSGATIPASAQSVPSQATPVKPIQLMPATAPPAPVGEGSWVLLVGSFADPTNAAQVQQKLIDAGYVPVLRVKIVDGKTWNSVQIRGYPTREAAQAKLDELRTKLGYTSLAVVQLQ